MFDDQCLRFFRFVVEAHEQQRVERIDRRDEQRLAIPIARRLAHGTQLVVSPRVLLIRLPRAEKLVANALRHRGVGSEHGVRCKKKGDDQFLHATK